MADQQKLSGMDESLVARVASLSEGSQRWLKTAIQAIRSGEVAPAQRAEAREKRRPAAPPKALKPPAADLEDVITGKADLREHLEAYPELSKEFEGLADVIDLLRESGERKRRRGEEVLRELLEGEERPEDGEDTPPER
jgi:hypothetical protein